MPHYLALLSIGLLLSACSAEEKTGSSLVQRADAQVDFIDGTVHSPTGEPEAGVWVIAETDALPTPFRKIVVTDDEGRFVLPELPQVTYNLWARGYGLQDSPRLSAQPGQTQELTLSPASLQQAATNYPASY